MIDFIKGTLVESGPGWMVVESNGLGYRLEVPLSLSGSSLSSDQGVTLHTRMLMKEDGLYLYGFSTSEERNLFNLILGVGGVGPRIALAALGEFTVASFYMAVLEENVSALSRVSGIGKKSAQRIILELKEKLPSSFSASPEQEAASPAESAEREAVEALISLGFSPAESARAAEKAGESAAAESSEQLLKAALKYLSQS